MKLKKTLTVMLCLTVCISNNLSTLNVYAGGTNKKAVWETTTVTTEVSTSSTTKSSLTGKAFIDVTPVYQGNLATGCEATGLTMVLNWYGYPVCKEDIALTYMPHQDFYYADGKKIGPDYRTTFAGDPRRKLDSYGCYIPCMIETVKRYAKDVGAKVNTTDLTGMEFYDLLEYIDKGIPVITITSNRLIEPIKGDYWFTPNGEKITWQRGHHCMILTGYDLNKGLVYVSESAYSYKTVYPIEDFINVYNAKGKNAMIITKQK